MAIVQALARILLEMYPFDTHGDAVATIEIDGHCSLTDYRPLVLANLIALRQIRIEIILAVENRFTIDLCFQPEPGADRLPHALFVDYGQHTRHGCVDERNMAVWGAT